jgi:F-type H+-transporting ATPase subunit delta
MRNQVLIKRYTQGLVKVLSSEEEFQALLGCLRNFQSLLQAETKLRQLLESPFLPTSKRLALARDVMQETCKMELPRSPKNNSATPSKMAARFILLLIENDRLSLLPAITDCLPLLWNEEQGISTFEVFSVIPLTASQKSNLDEKLSQLEKRPVSVSYSLDQSLIGGLSIQKGNIVYDVSIKGHLNKLKEKIMEN